MTSRSSYSRHIDYDHAVIEAAKDRLAPLRAKPVRRRVDDIVETQIKTLLSNRLRNIERPESEEKMGLLITGDSGSGKSSLVANRIVKDPVLVEQTLGNKFGFVSVKFKAPVRIPTAGLAVVRKLGLPNAQLNMRRDYWDEVVLRTTELKTNVLHFDEVQDAFRQNRAIAHTWLQMFKAVMTSELPVVLVLTGTPEMLPFFKSSDPQAARRLVPVELPSLTYPMGQASLARQVSTYCGMVGIANGLEGTDYERLMRASAYAFGRTLSLTLSGIQEAILAGAQTLQLVHLAHAYERDHPTMQPAQNMFWAPDYIRLSPFGAGYEAGPPKKKSGSVPRKGTKW